MPRWTNRPERRSTGGVHACKIRKVPRTRDYVIEVTLRLVKSLEDFVREIYALILSYDEDAKRPRVFGDRIVVTISDDVADDLRSSGHVVAPRSVYEDTAAQWGCSRLIPV